MQRAKDQMQRFERTWQDRLEMIKFQVANKPLLVEQGIYSFSYNVYS